MQRTFLILLGVFLVACTVSQAQALVEINGFVTDGADIFSSEEEAQLSAQLQVLLESGRLQVAVVTVPELEGMPIEEYAIRIAQANLGNSQADNGLLLLIAPADKQYRFEVGSGLEGTLNDAKIGRVGRTYLVPAFREEQYAAGVSQSIAAVDQLTQGIEPAGLEPAGEPFAGRVWVALIILFIVVQIVAAIAGRKRKNKYGDAAQVAAWMFMRPPGGGGGFGGGFGGGGGGGFGGGGFSGGGSSGGW